MGTTSHDAERLWHAAGRPGQLNAVCPQRFIAPLAPHLAARAEGKELDAGLLRGGIDYWRCRSDIVLVEGSGGLMSPVSDELYNADLAADFGYPLVVVTANTLGTINATLQTLIAARSFHKKIEVSSVILNQPRLDPDDHSVTSNRAELEKRCLRQAITTLGWQADAFEDTLDWFALAEPAKHR
jgi:dethiobiotin synthetase